MSGEVATIGGEVENCDPVGSTDADQFFEIHTIGWEGYEGYLAARGERSRPKMIYWDGALLLVSPSQPHEQLNVRLGRFFYEVVVTLRIPFLSLAQMTWRRQDVDAGVEGDQTYYITNEHRVRGKEIDLAIDPPPDLAIEVVHTHKADHALEIYRRLGVPEVWVCDKRSARILVLNADGEYVEATHSLALPFLSAVEIFEQSQQPAGMSDLDQIDGIRRWVQEVLIPRVPPP